MKVRGLINQHRALHRCLESLQLGFNLEVNSDYPSKWLILGGTGFIGKWLTMATLEWARRSDCRVQTVVATRNKASAEFSLRQFIPPTLPMPLLVTYKELLLEPQSEKLLNGVDTIFHAATPTAQYDGKILELLDLTALLIKKCRNLAQPRFIHLSSGGVYQRENFDGRLIPESTTRVNSSSSINVYQRVKVKLEEMVETATTAGFIRGCNPRLFSFAGPGFPLNRHFAFADFMNCAILKKPLVVRGHPLTRRSYMHPSDLVEWIFQLVSEIDKVGLKPVHIGNPVPISITELATRIVERVGGRIVQNEITSTSDWYVPDVTTMRSIGSTLKYSEIDSILDSWLRYLSPRETVWS